MDGARTKADDWDADKYSTNAGFVPELGKHVLEMLAPRWVSVSYIFLAMLLSVVNFGEKFTCFFVRYLCPGCRRKRCWDPLFVLAALASFHKFRTFDVARRCPWMRSFRFPTRLFRRCLSFFLFARRSSGRINLKCVFSFWEPLCLFPTVLPLSTLAPTRP